MARKPMTAEQKAEGGRISSQLKAAREGAGREQVEVARIAGVSVDELRKIEAGRVFAPSFVVVARLAKELGVALDPLARHVLFSNEQ
jgi:transcriptional regulator with XRE-family HTH domain